MAVEVLVTDIGGGRGVKVGHAPPNFKKKNLLYILIFKKEITTFILPFSYFLSTQINFYYVVNYVNLC